MTSVKLIRSSLFPLALCVSLLGAPTAMAEAEQHSIVIAGVAGTPGTWYKIEVDGSVEKIDGELDGFLVTAETDDIALGNLVRGEVQPGDADGFRITGEIKTLLIQDGVRALVMVDGTELDTSAPPAVTETTDAAEPEEEANEELTEAGSSSGAFVWKPTPPLSGKLRTRPLSPTNSNASSSQVEAETGNAPTPITIKPIEKPVDLVLVTPSPTGKADKGNETSGPTPLAFSQAITIFSGISGRRGEQQMSFDFASQPINAIGWNEKFDKPCGVGVITRVDGKPEKGRILARCGDDEPFMCEQSICTGSPTLGVSFQRSVQIAGLRAGITRLEVCTNNRRNGRVKGIRITGGEIGADGVGNVQSVDSDEMAHCRDWEKQVSCPTGSVATGIRAQFDKGSGASPNTDQIVGLELICRAVTAG